MKTPKKTSSIERTVPNPDHSNGFQNFQSFNPSPRISSGEQQRQANFPADLDAKLPKTFTKIFDYKTFFELLDIRFSHLIEKSEFSELKQEFDDSKKELGSWQMACEYLQQKYGRRSSNGADSASKNAKNNIINNAKTLPRSTTACDEGAPGGTTPGRRAAANSNICYNSNNPSLKALADEGSSEEILRNARKIVAYPIRWSGWARSILGLGGKYDQSELSSVYRNFMKKFHPDKQKQNSEQGNIEESENKTLIADALEKIKKAKALCDNELRSNQNQSVPGRVSRIRHTRPWATKGPGTNNDGNSTNCYIVHWDAPYSIANDLSIEKYIVQVFDGKFGRFLQISVVEPDYDEVLHSIYITIRSARFCFLPSEFCFLIC